MTTFLIVYEHEYEYTVNYLFYDYGKEDNRQKHYYSRLRSFVLQAPNKVEAYKMANKKLNNDHCNVVHIEELD